VGATSPPSTSARLSQGARRRVGTVRARARDRYYAARCARLLRQAPAGASPRAVFAGAPDDLWRWANIEGIRRSPELQALLPTLPADSVQKRFTGNSGKVTLAEGYRFVQLVKEQAERHHAGGLAGCRDVLDYGCGWGRIVRFWLKDFEPEHVTGIDCLEDAIELCRATIPGVRFELVDPYPPTHLAADSVDVISSFSVFSHLSEEAHLQWLAEFQRVLRPGGILTVTTWSRDFIDECEEFRRQAEAGTVAEHHSRSALAFVDHDGWVARYDRGEFCYEGTGGGPGLSSDFCGETLIPKAYVERVWSEYFDVLDYVSDRRRCTQDVIVARKR
jgi:SAM-dependent methyltransferase